MFYDSCQPLTVQRKCQHAGEGDVEHEGVEEVDGHETNRNCRGAACRARRAVCRSGMCWPLRCCVTTGRRARHAMAPTDTPPVPPGRDGALPLHPNPSHRPWGKARIYRRGEFQTRQTQSTCRHRAKVTGPLTSQEDIFAGHQQNACLLTQKETASHQGSRRASAAHAGAVVSTIHKRPRFVESAPL